MIETKRKEELSFSYLNAVCAYNGIAMERNVHDDDSVDVLIKKHLTRKDGEPYDSAIAVQLKSTSQILCEDDGFVNYSLKMKNYKDLCRKSTHTKLLFLLILPNNEDDWINHSVDQLIIRRCMYWYSFSTAKEIENKSGITLRIPKNQIVSPESLLALLQAVAEEEVI